MPRRSTRLLGTVALGSALLAASCLVGVRSSQPPPSAPAPTCPPRWSAADDPRAADVAAAVAALEADLPEGARALTPPRAVRLGPACPLSLPLRLGPGRCVLFAAQVFSSAERPAARFRYPDPLLDRPREFALDHSMMETFGEGADPVCYEDGLDEVVQVLVDGQGELVFLRAYEVSLEAARSWAAERRARLAEEALAARVARAPAPRPACPEPDADLDAGATDAAPDGSAGPCEEPAEAGLAADAAPVDGDLDAELAEAPQAVPEGPLAVELVEQCADGVDNDEDGAADCEDPECRLLCTAARLERAPWPRVLDLRLGGAYRVASSQTRASAEFDETYEPLEASWGFAAEASAVWRPNRYLGVGLDLDLAHLRMGSWVDGSLGARNRVGVLSVALGLSLQVSVPIWIVELGGSVGLGWLHLRTFAEEQLLSGDDTAWRDNPEFDLSFDAPAGSGRLWVDFWLVDGFALGLYGGVLAPLTQPHAGLVTNIYHVGLRITLRLGL